MYSLSENLRDLIIESGLSLRKLAEQSKVSATQYSMYLRGTLPTIDAACRICLYFDCSLDYLCGISDKNHKGLGNYDLTDFIAKYLNLLKENNTTHWKFSKEYDISESCLRHWKAGQIPKLETVIKIAKNLSTSIDYLVGRTDKKYSNN